MNIAKKSLTTVAGILLVASIVCAQEQNVTTGSRSTTTVTAAATTDRVRFTAPSTVVQMRLQVYAANGEKLFDNEIKGGNVIDWHLQNAQAERVSDGSYLCVITGTGLSGRVSQRLGTIMIENAAASVQPIDTTQLTAQQTQAVGPLEENASLTVLKEGETQTATVIAHNGEEGQITRGRGALSFRLGDFFSGKDTEQMRLTPEGNLGIGITHPQARLDVDGLIRTNQGVVFPDGTIQTTAAASASGGQPPVPSGDSGGLFKATGQATSSATNGKGKKKVSLETQGDPPTQIVPDDLIINGNILFTPALARDISMTSNIGGVRIFAAPTLTALAPTSAAIQFFGNGHAGFPGQAYIDSGAHNSAAVILRTAQTGGTITERMRVTAGGNVGIGANGPQRLLSVQGGMNIDQANGNNGLIDNGTVATGNGLTFGSFSGEGIASKRTSGGNLFGLDFYTGFANRMSISNGGNVGIGISNPSAPLHINAPSLAPPFGLQPSENGLLLGTNGTASYKWIQSYGGALILNPQGNSVGIGTSGPNAFTLQVEGSVGPNSDNSNNLGSAGLRWSAVWAANGTIQTSDARLKKAVTNLGYGLSQVMQLRPVSFQWKDRTDGRTHLGLIAQEVESIIPEAVERDKDPATPLGMNYTSLVPVVIKAMQEQQMTLSALKAENAALTARLAGLEKKAAKDLALARQRHSRLHGVNHVVSTENSTPSRSKAGSGLVAQN